MLDPHPLRTPSRRPAARRRFPPGARACVIFLALVAALYAFRNPLFGPSLVSMLAGLADRETGLLIDAGAVSGSWFRDLTFHDVRVRGGDRSPWLASASADKLDVRYSLLRFLRRDPMPLDEVTIVGLRGEFDAAAKALPRTEPAPPFRPPPVLPRIELRDASIVVNAPGAYRARLEGVDLVSLLRGDANDLRLDAGRIVIFRDGEALLSGSLSTTGNYDGKILRLSRLRVNEDDVAIAASLGWDRDGTPGVQWRVGAATVTTEGVAYGGTLEARIATHSLRAGSVLAPLLSGPAAPPDAICDVALDFSGRPGDLSSWDLSVAGELRNACAWNMTASRIGVDARFLDGILSVRELVVEQPGNRVEIRDARLPLPVTDLESGVRLLTGQWILEGCDLMALSPVALPPGIRELAPPHRASFAGTFGDGELRIETGRADIPHGSAFMVEPARLRPLWASPSSIEDVELEGMRFTALLADIRAIPALAALGIEGRACCSIAVEGSWGRPSATVHLFSDGLRRGDLAPAAFSADAAWEPSLLRIGPAVATSSDWMLEFSGTIDLQEKTFDGIRLDAALYDAASLSLGGLAGGSAALRADVSGPVDRPEATVALEGRSLRTERLTLDRADALLRIEGLRADVEAVEIAGAFGVLNAAGDIEHDPSEGRTRARVSRLRFATRYLELNLAEPAEVTLADGFASVPQFRLLGPDGGVSVRLLWDRPLAEIDVVLDTIDVRPLALLAAPDADASGRLSGHLHIVSQADGLSWDARVNLESLRLGGDARAVDGTLETSGSDGRARVGLFEVRSGDHVWASLTAEAPYDPAGAVPFPEGDLAVRAALNIPDTSDLPLPLPASWAGLEGALTAEAEFGGTTSGLIGDLAFSADRIRWKPDTVRTDSPIGPGAARLRLRMTPDGILISGEGALAGILEARLEGAAAGPVDLRAAARDGLAGLLDRRLELAFDVSSAELDGLAAGAGPLRRLTGAFHLHATAEGPLRAPDLRGGLRWENGSMRLAALPASFRQLELRAQFEGSEIRIERAEGEVAGAPFSLSGRIALGGGEPVADLALTGRDILLARGNGLQLRADANLDLTGTVAALRLSGDVTIRDSWYRRDFRPTDFLEGRRRTAPRRPEMFSLPNPPWSGLEFDVRIGAKDAFRIETNLARLRLRPQLTLSGTGRDPALEGLVYVDPGFLVLPSGRLNIDAGIASVHAANPLVPRLEVQGSARVFGYDINLQATGPYDDPEILLSASPPLTQEDILVMLATGSPPATGDAGGSSGQAGANLLLYFGGTQLPRWLGAGEGSPGRELMDRLEVELGREVSPTGARSVEMSLRLHPPDPFLASYGYYLTAEQDIYRRINMGLRWTRKYR